MGGKKEGKKGKEKRGKTVDRARKGGRVLKGKLERDENEKKISGLELLIPFPLVVGKRGPKSEEKSEIEKWLSTRRMDIGTILCE